MAQGKVDRMMAARVLTTVASAMIALAGCRAVHEARVTQKIVAPVADGAAVSTNRVDLRSCVDASAVRVSTLCEFALTNRPSMVESFLALEDARLTMRQLAADAPLVSGTPWNALHATASAGRSAASRSAKFDDLREKTYGDASGALSLELLVWDFGRHDAEVRAQAENVLAAELDCIRSSYAVIEEVSEGCFSLLENDALFEVALTNEFEYAEHLRQAENRLKAGEARKLDVTRARLDLATARENTVAASNAVASAEAKFMCAIGVDAAHGDRRDVFGDFRSGVTACYRAYPDTDFDVAEAFEIGRTNAPSVRLARAKLKAANARVDAAVADLAPSVSASVSLDWTDPLWLWRWGVNGVQSIFTGGRKTAALERATVALSAAAAAVERAEHELSLAIELAVSERDNAREALATAVTSVQRARENLDTVREQYLVGDVGSIEYTDAVSDYSKALGNRVTAFYRGQVAEARLYALTGRVPTFREERVFGSQAKREATK